MISQAKQLLIRLHVALRRNPYGHPISLNDDVIVNTEEASVLLRTPVTSIIKWCSTGEHNIPFIKIGRNLFSQFLGELLSHLLEIAKGNTPSIDLGD